MNKKGGFEEPAIIPLFLAIAAMFLVFLLVFVLFSFFRNYPNEGIGIGDAKIRMHIKANDINYRLVQFLRTEADIDGKQVSMAELLGDNKKDDKEFVLFKENALRIFELSEQPEANQRATAHLNWRLRVYPSDFTDYRSDSEGVYEGFSIGSIACNKDGFIAKVTIPTYEGKELDLVFCGFGKYMEKWNE